MLLTLLLLAPAATAPVPQATLATPPPARGTRTPLGSGAQRRSAAGSAVRTPGVPGASDLPHPSTNPFNITSFGYSDPHPPEFHPLGEQVFTGSNLEECVFLTDSFYDVTGVRRDDDLHGGGASGLMPGMPSLSSRVSATAGSMRGDGSLQLVTLDSVNGTGTRLQVWDRASNGAYFLVHQERIPSFWDASLACADLDGDGRDELAIGVRERSNSRRHELWVYEDLIDGSWGTATTLPQLDSRYLGTGGFGHTGARIVKAELDGDERDELFVVVSTGQFSLDAYGVDDLNSGLTVLVSDNVGPSHGDDDFNVCAVDSDGDGIDELAVRGDSFIVVERLSGSGLASAGSWDVNPNLGSNLSLGLAACDWNGDGQEEVVYVRTETQFGGFPSFDEYDSAWLVSRRRTSATGWTQTMDTFLAEQQWPSNSRVTHAPVVSLEDDNDAGRELRGVLRFNSGDIYEFRADGQLVTDVDSRALLGQIDDLLLVKGDDDKETFRLRWTGSKELFLPEPLPIAVMEAVPTKDGIEQNYAASGSTFSESSGSASSVSTTSSTTFGLTAGLTTPDLFGLLGAEIKATVSGTITDTTGSTESTRTYTTYGSSSDVHSIVFQGTLYHAYLYEILDAANPAAVGTITSVNVPVGTNEWKWTLDTYNQYFPNHRIEPSVVFGSSNGPVEIGDPTTYPGQAELEGYVTGSSPLHIGWVGGSSTVGQGTSFNGFGLALGSVSTTSSERTLSIDVATQFEAGGTIFGAHYGVSSGDVYTVEISSTTDYGATIGDIAPVDYGNWSYEAGLVVYQDRITGEYPFQVLRHWVETAGTSY